VGSAEIPKREEVSTHILNIPSIGAVKPIVKRINSWRFGMGNTLHHRFDCSVSLDCNESA
jgi:hypothetical protein